MRFGRYDALAGDEHSGALSSGMLAVHDGRDRDAAAQLESLKKDRDDVGVISAAVLDAAICAHRGDRDSEIAALAHAADVQDREGYSEPPLFWKPMREALGAAYYRAGRYDDAERAFRATLVHDRDDPRALFGLARTLEREGRPAEAGAIDTRFAYAWRQADSTLDMKDL
jgi:hypothetical protein